MKDIKTSLDAKGRTCVTLKISESSKIGLTYFADSNQAHIFIGYKLKNIDDKRWYYQSMNWHCRGGRSEYYRPMLRLYRYLRENGITQNTLRYLCWGENRTRNNGYAIGTEGFRNYQAIRRSMAEQKAADLQVKAQLPQALSALTESGWLYQQHGERKYSLHMLEPNAKGLVRNIWIDQMFFDSVVVSQSTGKPGCYYNPAEGKFGYAVTVESDARTSLSFYENRDNYTPEALIDKTMNYLRAAMSEMAQDETVDQLKAA